MQPKLTDQIRQSVSQRTTEWRVKGLACLKHSTRVCRWAGQVWDAGPGRGWEDRDGSGWVPGHWGPRTRGHWRDATMVQPPALSSPSLQQPGTLQLALLQSNCSYLQGAGHCTSGHQPGHRQTTNIFCTINLIFCDLLQFFWHNQVNFKQFSKYFCTIKFFSLCYDVIFNKLLQKGSR